MSTHVPGLRHVMWLKLHSYGHKTLDQAVNMVEINHVFLNRFLFKKNANTVVYIMHAETCTDFHLLMRKGSVSRDFRTLFFP